jgi:spore coat polysaccharide biosynthesis protein SpsF
VKVVIIVQARMTSTRLPGKVLKLVLNKPLLEYQIERLQRVRSADDIVIATTVHSTDDPIVGLCDRLSVHHYRGPEEDVLARYHGAAVACNADAIIRVTSDCPVIDPAVIDRVARFFIEHRGDYDYVSNTQVRSYPRGMDTEVFSFAALCEAFHEASKPAEREHVTPFIYTNSHRYRLADIVHPEDESRHRWTVDTPEDFELIKRIIESLYPSEPHFDLKSMLDLIRHNPEWMKINEHIEQKKLGAAC